MFRLDAAFARSSHPIVDLGLCAVRLHDDARWPWIVLVPRVEQARAIEDLPARDRARLMQEIVLAGAGVRAVGLACGLAIEKLNVGLLGNVTPQLHAHVVGRRAGDPAWPGPVWGFGAPEPYPRPTLARALAAAAEALRA
jgi:diadenosine tetraphosphate (Ap4A) HIT family hydrolase